MQCMCHVFLIFSAASSHPKVCKITDFRMNFELSMAQETLAAFVVVVVVDPFLLTLGGLSPQNKQDEEVTMHSLTFCHVMMCFFV
jgi:hypothetical protein